MSEEENQGQAIRGLGILSKDRPITHSISRALENQVVGSIFNQTDKALNVR